MTIIRAAMCPTQIFLTADWRMLAILNYVVEPSLLRQFIPSGTELDQWNGKVFVSLVGFRFLRTRVLRIPIPFHSNFDEVNLRFYVRRKEGPEIRRGVVFIKEIVPRWAIATAARMVYNERYISLPMRHRIRANGKPGLEVEYKWRFRGTWNRLSLITAGNPFVPEDGSQEQFITEHYWGYAAQRDDGCMEYRVEHPSWRVWNGIHAQCEGDLTGLYGQELGLLLQAEPNSAFLAEGSEVAVHRGRRLQ
jgi:uncharacterized protein YqjF (DUF2071 family)